MSRSQTYDPFDILLGQKHLNIRPLICFGAAPDPGFAFNRAMYDFVHSAARGFEDTVNLSSSSVADAFNGAGARTVRLHGLSQGLNGFNYLENTEEYSMVSADFAVGINNFKWINAIETLTTGANRRPAGNLIATDPNEDTIFRVNTFTGADQLPLPYFNDPTSQLFYNGGNFAVPDNCQFLLTGFAAGYGENTFPTATQERATCINLKCGEIAGTDSPDAIIKTLTFGRGFEPRKFDPILIPGGSFLMPQLVINNNSTDDIWTEITGYLVTLDRTAALAPNP